MASWSLTQYSVEQLSPCEHTQDRGENCWARVPGQLVFVVIKVTQSTTHVELKGNSQNYPSLCALTS